MPARHVATCGPEVDASGMSSAVKRKRRPSHLVQKCACLLGRFRSDARASAAIEFAMLAVPFLGVLCCIIELGVTLLLGMVVENTTQQIARLIKTGQLQQYNIQSVADFRSKLLCPSTGAPLLPVYLSCGRLAIDVRTSDAINDANLGDDIYKAPASAKFCLGSPQSIVVVRLAYALPAMLPVLAIMSNGALAQSRTGLVNDVPDHPGWNHLLFHSAAFQNETYDASSTSACS